MQQNNLWSWFSIKFQSISAQLRFIISFSIFHNNFHFVQRVHYLTIGHYWTYIFMHLCEKLLIWGKYYEIVSYWGFNVEVHEMKIYQFSRNSVCMCNFNKLIQKYLINFVIINFHREKLHAKNFNWVYVIWEYDKSISRTNLFLKKTSIFIWLLIIKKYPFY